MKKELTVRDDPPRKLEDSLLRFRIEKHLSVMDNDNDRAEWIATCVRGHSPDENLKSCCCSLSHEVVEKRLEFLNEVERIEWFRKLMDVGALLPRPTENAKKESDRVSGALSLIPEESLTSVSIPEDSLTS
ncbi:MAG: hypothetical protein SGARI_007529, partial [Bacillariaceae sp.]